MTREARTSAAETTVLITGGGPSGLAAAAELGRHRVDCVVLEPRVDISHSRPRAKTTSIRTMEHLRRWGVADALRAAAPIPVTWARRVVFCESLSGEAIVEIDDAFGLDPKTRDVAAELGQQVPQPVVEEVLRRHVRSLHAASLRTGCSVTGLTQDDESVTVHYTDEAGRPVQIQATYVLGCDGAAGVVRDQIGARYLGRSDSRNNFNVVFRAPGLTAHMGAAVQYWVLGERVTGVLGRLDLAGTWWAIFPGIDQAYGSANVSHLLAELVGHDFEHDVVATDPWRARLLVADRFRRGRVFLVGESAHLNPPWGGHGYNTSVGDAVNVAWKIAAAVQGWGGPHLLDSYEHERRSVVEQTVAAAGRNMGHLPGDLRRDPASIRAAKVPEFHSLGLVLGYTYAGSPIVQPDDGSTTSLDGEVYEPTPAAGARLPHHWLPDGSSLYDRLGRGYTLLTPPDAAQTADAFFARAAALEVPISVLTLPDSYRWTSDYLLVRPDQHIAWRTADPDAIDLQRVLGNEVTSHDVPARTTCLPRTTIGST